MRLSRAVTAVQQCPHQKVLSTRVIECKTRKLPQSTIISVSKTSLQHRRERRNKSLFTYYPHDFIGTLMRWHFPKPGLIHCLLKEVCCISPTCTQHGAVSGAGTPKKIRLVDGGIFNWVWCISATHTQNWPVLGAAVLTVRFESEGIFLQRHVPLGLCRVEVTQRSKAYRPHAILCVQTLCSCTEKARLDIYCKAQLAAPGCCQISNPTIRRVGIFCWINLLRGRYFMFEGSRERRGTPHYTTLY